MSHRKCRAVRFLAKRPANRSDYIFGARDRCDETDMRIRTVRDARYRYIRNFTPEVPFLAPNKYKEKQYPVWNLLKELNAAGQVDAGASRALRSTHAGRGALRLQIDPHEINNLATSSDPKDQAALKRLRAVLANWITETMSR